MCRIVANRSLNHKCVLNGDLKNILLVKIGKNLGWYYMIKLDNFGILSLSLSRCYLMQVANRKYFTQMFPLLIMGCLSDHQDNMSV